MELSGKNVLVTGSDGFIGSHLAETLQDSGANVKAFVYYNSFGSWGWLDTLPKERLDALEVFAGDVRDPNGVRVAWPAWTWSSISPRSSASPTRTTPPTATSTPTSRGRSTCCRRARDQGTERVIVTSTSEVYGTARYVPIDEGHPLQGQSPYSATKIGADKIAESFWRSFETPVVTARPFNTYGPRQSARAVIPDDHHAAADGPRPDRARLLDTHSRPHLRRRTPCAGFVALGVVDEAVGRDVNIGNGAEISIGDLAKLIMEIAGREAQIVTRDERTRPQASEVERLLADATLISKLTGWAPATTLREGLQATVEWFWDEANRARYKADIYNV